MYFLLFNQNSSKTDSNDPVTAPTEGISKAETTVDGHHIIPAEKNQYVNHGGILTLHRSLHLFRVSSVFSRTFMLDSIETCSFTKKIGNYLNIFTVLLMN